MESSYTSFLEKNLSGSQESNVGIGSGKKKGGFPGFKDFKFKQEELEKMEDKELHRFYKLYGNYIVKEFYKVVGDITTPTRFKIEDLISVKRKGLVTTRLATSGRSCSLMRLWMKNMLLLNYVIYKRFVPRSEDEED